MPDSLYLFFFNWEFFCFLILGLCFGRIGAALALFLPIYEGCEENDKNEKKNSNNKKIKDFLPFFVDCQNNWGWYPLSCAVKKLRKQPSDLQPLVMEILLAFLFILLFYTVGWSFLLIEYLLFVFALTVAGAVDLKHFILPDTLTLSGIVIGLLGAVLNPELGREFWPALSGLLMGGGFLWLVALLYYAVRKEEGLGGGDIKLLAWMGAVLTWEAIPFIILMACFSAVIFALLGAFQPGNWLKKNIPFGPYLAASGFIYIFYGKEVSHLYLSFFIPL